MCTLRGNMAIPRPEEEQRSMPYPSVFRTRRIVFLVALLFPTATLAYITLPHGDITLRGQTASARTQDIPIGAHTRRALPGMPFMAAPAPLLDRSFGVRSAADEAAIDELALAT